MSLRELFRKKLEGAEIVPDASVSTKLMRKLAMQEFIHFNPFRLNIYYLGGILVAAVTTAIILTSGSGKPELLTNQDISTGINKGNIENAIIPAEQNIIQKSDSQAKKISGSGKKRQIVRREILIAQETAKIIEPMERKSISPSGVIDSFGKKGLFSGSSVDSKNLRNSYKPQGSESELESSVTEGCLPLKVLFHNRLNEGDSCRWSFGDGGSSASSDPEWIYDVEGEYRVILKVYGTNGIVKTSSSVITVHARPAARFEISPEKAVLPDDAILFLNYSANAVRFHWDFGDGTSSELFEPLHRYSKFGNYNIRLVVYSEYGCSDSLIVMNAFSGSGNFITFPNALIPSKDGPLGGSYSLKSDEAAQVFHPSFSGVSDYHLKIFSKLGILIFESNDINIGWDGYYNGQLSNPGVYIWKVRGKFRNGEPFIKMGDVTLLGN